MQVGHAVQIVNVFLAGGDDEPATLLKPLEISHRDREKRGRSSAESDDRTECARELTKNKKKRRRLLKEGVAWPPSPVMHTPNHSALDAGSIAAGTPTRLKFSSDPSHRNGDYASSQSPTVVSSSQSSAIQGLRKNNLSALRRQPTNNERECQASTVGDREAVTEIMGIQSPEEDGQTALTKPDVGRVVEVGSGDAHSLSSLATQRRRRWPSSPTKMTTQDRYGVEHDRPGASGANDTTPKPGEAASSGIACSSSGADAAFGDGSSNHCLAVKRDGNNGNSKRRDVNLGELPRQGGSSRSRRCEETEENSEISEAETVTQEEFCAICQMDSELSDAGPISPENCASAGLDEGEQGDPSVSADRPAGKDVTSPRATLSSTTSSIVMLVPRSTECQAPLSLSTGCSDGNSSPFLTLASLASPTSQSLNTALPFTSPRAHLSGLAQAMPASEKVSEAREIDKRRTTSALLKGEKGKHDALEIHGGTGEEGTHLPAVDIVSSPGNIELATQLGVGEDGGGGKEEGDGRAVAENVEGENGCTRVGQTPLREDHASDAAAKEAASELVTYDAGALNYLNDVVRRGNANGNILRDVPAEFGNSCSPTEKISHVRPALLVA